MRRTPRFLPLLCAVLAVHVLAASGPATDATQLQRQKRFNDLSFGRMTAMGKVLHLHLFDAPGVSLNPHATVLRITMR
jgi:hypothetical protein